MWAHLLGQRPAHGLLLHMPFLRCLQYKHPFPSLPFWVWINPEVAGEEASPAWVTWWEISPVKAEGKDLGVSASRHPVGDVTSIRGSSSYDWQSRERERGPFYESHRRWQRATWMKQLGTGRAENPSWKTEADLPKTDTALQYFGNTRNRFQVFPEMTWPTPDWVQLHDIKAIQLGWHMALSRLSWGGSAGLEKTTLLHVTVLTCCGLEREILWILTALLGLSPGPALRLPWEESLEKLHGAAIASPVTRESCSLNAFVLLIPRGLHWLGPQKPSPAFPSFSSLTRSSLPPAYFHISLESRALLKPHSSPEFVPQHCYRSTGISSIPPIPSCSSLAFSDSPAGVPSHVYKGRRERKASRGQRAPELNQEADELFGFGHWCEWLWANSTDSCLGTSVDICRRSWVPPGQKPNATCYVGIGAMRMQRIKLSWLLQTYWITLHSFWQACHPPHPPARDWIIVASCCQVWFNTSFYFRKFGEMETIQSFSFAATDVHIIAGSSQWGKRSLSLPQGRQEHDSQIQRDEIDKAKQRFIELSLAELEIELY